MRNDNISPSKDEDMRRIRKLLLDGANSPMTRPIDNAYFEGLRDLIRRGEP